MLCQPLSHSVTSLAVYSEWSPQIFLAVISRVFGPGIIQRAEAALDSHSLTELRTTKIRPRDVDLTKSRDTRTTHEDGARYRPRIVYMRKSLN